MRYQVTVGDRRLDVDVDGARVTVDGVECHAELRSLPGTPLRQLVLDARSFVFLMESRERGAWVLEAMKMQNELKAAGAAVVEHVAIAPGRTVEKGEVLVTFAPAHLT